jgi:pimeloyl-ACP methyl ester carboxylesterase
MPATGWLDERRDKSMRYTALLQRFFIVSATCTALACSAAPVSVQRLEPRNAYLALTHTALTSSEISQASLRVLRRADLVEVYAADPTVALAALHEKYASGAADELYLFALAEISFAYATETRDKAYFLAAAMYAFAQLDPTASTTRLSRVDPRVRVNTDIYNWAISAAFASQDGDFVVLEAGKHALPFGEITVSFDVQQLLWNNRQLGDFLPASHFDVRGLKNRYWHPGVGTPLTAHAHVIEGEPQVEGLFIPNIRVAVTAILDFEDIGAQLRSGKAEATLKLYADTDTVDISGVTLPLESEPSVALAQTVVELDPWQNEISSFVGKVLSRPQEGRLMALEPARLDRIPIVFVHGTASSSARWIDMLNDIAADPEMRQTYQFWFFNYDSGGPILYSAMKLRQALNNLVGSLDPEGSNPCLGSMVVIGHSQGGLLVKLVAVDSGTQFWDTISDSPFDEVSLSDDTRELLEQVMFFEAVSSIDRVVFIATPHRGSYRARYGFVHSLARRMISMPSDVARASADMLNVRDNERGYLKLDRINTSIENMSPGSRPLLVLEPLPIDADITAHSIIPVLPHNGPLEEGNDGIVEYKSARLDGVASELIVESGHSCQSNPNTVNEVLRILRLDRPEAACAAPPVQTELR